MDLSQGPSSENRRFAAIRVRVAQHGRHLVEFLDVQMAVVVLVHAAEDRHHLRSLFTPFGPRFSHGFGAKIASKSSRKPGLLLGIVLLELLRQQRVKLLGRDHVVQVLVHVGHDPGHLDPRPTLPSIQNEVV